MDRITTRQCPSGNDRVVIGSPNTALAATHRAGPLPQTKTGAGGKRELRFLSTTFRRILKRGKGISTKFLLVCPLAAFGRAPGRKGPPPYGFENALGGSLAANRAGGPLCSNPTPRFTPPEVAGPPLGGLFIGNPPSLPAGFVARAVDDTPSAEVGGCVRSRL